MKVIEQYRLFDPERSKYWDHTVEQICGETLVQLEETDTIAESGGKGKPGIYVNKGEYLRDVEIAYEIYETFPGKLLRKIQEVVSNIDYKNYKVEFGYKTILITLKERYNITSVPKEYLYDELNKNNEPCYREKVFYCNASYIQDNTLKEFYEQHWEESTVLYRILFKIAGLI